MTIKNILTEPNKLLRQISKRVEKVGEEERRLMNDMLDTMYAANGIGLAAIQIGIPKRIIIIDTSKDANNKKPMYFVNPVIQKKQQINQFTKRAACQFQTNTQKLKDLANVKLNI